MNDKQTQVLKILNEKGRKDLADAAASSFSDCSKCDAECCKYLIFPLPTFDASYLKYLLYHGAQLLVNFDEKSIEALIDCVCLKLNCDNTCSIYEDRPDICKEYSNIFCFDIKKEKDENILMIRTLQELEKNKDRLKQLYTVASNPDEKTGDI